MYIVLVREHKMSFLLFFYGKDDQIGKKALSRRRIKGHCEN